MQANKQKLKKLGNKIKQLREEKNISLSGFAYRNNIELSTLSRIEKGQVDPKYSTLIALVKALQIDGSELFE